VTMQDARRLVLALPEVSEQDHHGMPSFRVRGKIFATVPGPGHLRLMLSEDVTHAAVAADPGAFEELWWGKRLCGVSVRLDSTDGDRFADLLEEAWRRKAPRALAKRLRGPSSRPA